MALRKVQFYTSYSVKGLIFFISMEWATEAFTELIHAWVGSVDLVDFEEAIGGLAFFMFSEVSLPPVHDRIFWNAEYLLVLHVLSEE